MPTYKNPKGAAWERETAKLLSRWVLGNDKHLIFRRNPGSGGGKNDKDGLASSGDIIAIRSEGIKFIEEFSVECKFYNAKQIRPTLHWILFGGGIVEKFIDQAKEDADKYGKSFLLCYKINNFEPMVVSDSPKFAKLPFFVCLHRGDGKKATESLYLAPMIDLLATNYRRFMK